MPIAEKLAKSKENTPMKQELFITVRTARENHMHTAIMNVKGIVNIGENLYHEHFRRGEQGGSSVMQTTNHP